MNLRRIFIECPSCGTPARSTILVSGNTFHSIVWTDSKIVAPRFPQFPEFTRCYNCQHLYWISEAQEIYTEIRDLEEYKRLSRTIEEVAELEETDYFEALAHKVWGTKDQEKRLRILTLWKVNDKFRKSTKVKEDEMPTIIKLPETIRENLSLLEPLLDIGNQDEILLKVEVFRELQHFGAAKKVLGICFEQYSGQSESWIKAAKYIQDLVEANDNVVRILPV